MTLCNNWITPTDLVTCDCPDDASSAVVDMSLTVASELMYAWTGRQYPGTCEETLRPCGNDGDPYTWTPYLWSYPWTPMRLGGQWVNTGPCGCHMRTCGCGPYPSVNLGRSDVQTVTEVLIDGSALAASAYRLDSNQWLTRVDGSNWPCCQDLSEPTTEEGTWSISITYGFAVPETLKRAAAILASEFIKACEDADNCRLPARATSVIRQGVDIEITPAGLLQDGQTGIWEIDMAILAYNPNRLQRRPMVWSPELSGRALRS